MKNLTENVQKLFAICLGRIRILVKWMLLGGLSGAGLGLLGGLFAKSIVIVQEFRTLHPWMLYFLPLAGLAIAGLYKLDHYKTSTNLVLECIHKGKYVPLRMAPLIVISTVITHAFGGSAGREGAALQLGGSIGGTLGQKLNLDAHDRRIMIMAGMSGAFSALFGTPLTATIFSIEVVNVGIMEYAALVPCAFSALGAHAIAELIGESGEHFSIPTEIPFDFKNATLIIFLALFCALVSIIFCQILHKTEHLAEEKFPNPFLRIVVGAILVIVLTTLLHTTDYLGTGMSVIERAIDGETVPWAFLLKMIFTACTLGFGFKGGEIVPTLFVGSTFGCFYGTLVGLSPGLCAACGMVAMFAGVTNCPVSSLILGFELFGFDCMPFFLFSVAVSYMESGYFGLYHSQKFLYSKTKSHAINQKTK